MRSEKQSRIKWISSLTAAALLVPGIALADKTLLNVSYDPTRELYQELNDVFAKSWLQSHGEKLEIKQSHAGSGKQARSVIDGLQADVVTLALAYDIDEISQRARSIPGDWRTKLPENSSPYTSTIVFVVRKGNPKGIKDWDDLVKPGVQVITPNPKTGGGARWNFLAAWGYARHKYGSDERAREFVTKLFRNVPVLDSGARGATTTFAQRGIGDVLVSWENEAFLSQKEFAGLEIITPSESILAEPPVAVVEKNTKKHGTEEVAKVYLTFLYSEQGQELAAKHFYRPRNQKIAAKYASQFLKLKLFSIDQEFGGWAKAHPTYFADGGVFDQIYSQQAQK